MKTVIAKAGETFAQLAKRVMGFESEAFKIINSNPGVAEPMPSDAVLVVPDEAVSKSVSDFQFQKVRGGKAVSVISQGKALEFWTSFELVKKYNGISEFYFSAPYDAGSLAFEFLQPYTYSAAQVKVGEKVTFTGVFVSPTYRVESNSRTIDFAFFGKAGHMQGCPAPVAMYPLEFRNVKLKTIAEKLCQPFGVSTIFAGDVGEPFKKVALAVGSEVLPFLVKLAKERGLIVFDSDDGELVFAKATKPGNPVAALVEGQSPVLSVNPTYDGQALYSSVSGIRKPVIGGLTPEIKTVRNTALKGVFRPYAFVSENARGAELLKEVQATAGRMFADAAQYEVEVSGFEDAGGMLWRPNSTVLLTAPNAGVKSQYEFFVRSVAFRQETDRRTASLDLVIPEAMTSQIPARVPWS